MEPVQEPVASTSLYPRPIGDRIFVLQDDAVDKIGSIYTPQGSEDWPTYGVVIAIGSKVEYPEFNVGDRVCFKRRPNSAFIPDNREIFMCPEEWKNLLRLKQEDILAVVGVQ